MTDQTPSAQVPVTEQQLALMATTLRHQAATSEIQTRAAARWGILAFSMTALAFSLAAGMAAFAAPFLLVFLGFWWMHEDKRMGAVAHYKKLIEDRLEKYDGMGGLEDYLDSKGRGERKRFHVPVMLLRIFFPSLQVAATVRGFVAYLQTPPIQHTTLMAWLVWSAVGLNVAIIAFTAKFVRHVR